jgi:hypothetical protein
MNQLLNCKYPLIEQNECYFKSWFSIHKTYEIRWQIIENYYPSIICVFLKAREVSSWFMEIMLVLCINTVHSIRLKMLFLNCSEGY